MNPTPRLTLTEWIVLGMALIFVALMFAAAAAKCVAGTCGGP